MKPTLPKKERIRTGSNLRGKGLSAQRSLLLTELRQVYQRHVDAYRRAAKKLFSKTDLRTATGIVVRLRHEYHASNLKLGSEGEKWEANKASFRKQLQLQLARALPKYREWLAIARPLQREYDKLVAAHVNRPVAGRFDIGLGGILPDPGDAEEFVPPYPLFDVSIEDVTNYPDVEDQSFAIPSVGHVVNNVSLEYDDDTSILNGIFSLYLPVYGWSRSGCGINYTVPEQGHLRIGAVLQNFHTRVTLSLDDNFGFSMGRVYADASLYADIVRGTRLTHLSQTLVQKTLKSDGDDTSTTLPALDDTTPYVLDLTTDEIFEAGAAVQIIAGSEFISGCLLDDMKAHVDALLWSQVQKITVEVV